MNRRQRVTAVGMTGAVGAVAGAVLALLGGGVGVAALSLTAAVLVTAVTLIVRGARPRDPQLHHLVAKFDHSPPR